MFACVCVRVPSERRTQKAHFFCHPIASHCHTHTRISIMAPAHEPLLSFSLSLNTCADCGPSSYADRPPNAIAIAIAATRTISSSVDAPRMYPVTGVRGVASSHHHRGCPSGESCAIETASCAAIGSATPVDGGWCASGGCRTCACGRCALTIDWRCRQCRRRRRLLRPLASVQRRRRS